MPETGAAVLVRGAGVSRGSGLPAFTPSTWLGMDWSGAVVGAAVVPEVAAVLAGTAVEVAGAGGLPGTVAAVLAGTAVAPGAPVSTTCPGAGAVLTDGTKVVAGAAEVLGAAELPGMPVVTMVVAGAAVEAAVLVAGAAVVKTGVPEDGGLAGTAGVVAGVAVVPGAAGVTAGEAVVAAGAGALAAGVVGAAVVAPGAAQ